MTEKIITCKTCGAEIPNERVLEAASGECKKCTTRAIARFTRGLVKARPVTISPVPVSRHPAKSRNDLLEENRALKRMIVGLCRKIRDLQGKHIH